MLTPKLFTELRQYSFEKGVADLFAGMTVGVVALPLAMAFAIASGVGPERGLFTAIVAGFIISFLGGSKVQIGGPTGAFVVLVYSVMERFGYEALTVCMLIAGILLLLFGIFRMGGLIKFIPFPVITGFTSGIAVVIFSTQIRDLFGLSIDTVPAEFISKWQCYVLAAGSVNYHAAGIGIGTIGLIMLFKRFYPKMPAMLIVMILAAIVCSFFNMPVETISSRFGQLPAMLPSPSMPHCSWSQLPDLFQPAFTIALLAAIESLLSATVADGMISGRHRSNAELMAQGVANIFCSVFGGIPATGAIARTATNVKSGAKTPVAGLVHALTLALLLLCFGRYAGTIPLAALAGILVVVCFNMCEAYHFKTILKGPASDAFVLLLTFALTILIDLTVAVEVGVVLSALIFVRRMADLSNVGVITREFGSDAELDKLVITGIPREVPEGIEIFEVSGPFFFGMIDVFRNATRDYRSSVAPIMVLRIRNVPLIDATGIHVLRELNNRCKKEGITLVLSGVGLEPYKTFQLSGLLDEIGPENVCQTIELAIKRVDELLDKNQKNASK